MTIVYVVVHETKHETSLSVHASYEDATDAVGRYICCSIHPDKGTIVVSESDRERVRTALSADSFDTLTATWQDISDECFRVEKHKIVR